MGHGTSFFFARSLNSSCTPIVLRLHLATSSMKPKPSSLLTMPKSSGRPAFPVESRILVVRQRRVILDSDLAQVYGVPVKRLNQQVLRNRDRFPSDFMFQLNSREHKFLRLQFATSNKGRGGRRYAPYAFTEHGAIMAATVLNSSRAVRTSVFVVRAFVHLRDLVSTNRKLAAKLAELEDRVDAHDTVIIDLLKAIRQMTATRKRSRRCIGFEMPQHESDSPAPSRLRRQA